MRKKRIHGIFGIFCRRTMQGRNHPFHSFPDRSTWMSMRRWPVVKRMFLLFSSIDSWMPAKVGKVVLQMLLPFMAMGTMYAETPTVSPSSSVPFLSIPSDARAMGTASVISSADAFSVFHHSASVAFSAEKAAVGYGYTSWTEDGTGHALGGYLKTDDTQSILFGLRHFGQPKETIQGMDAYGVPTQKYTVDPSDWALDLAYTSLISPQMSISVGARYLISRISSDYETAHTLAFDVGIWYQEDESDRQGTRYSWGLRLSNLGSKLDYGGDPVDLPFIMEGGLYWHTPWNVKHAISYGLDVDYRLRPSDARNWGVRPGVEYAFNDRLFVCVGYHWASYDDDTNATCGLGYRFQKIRIDAACLLAPSDDAYHGAFSLSAAWAL